MSEGQTFMRYFENTRKNGHSHIALWIFVLWITVLGWLVAQFVITGPIDPILADSHPQLRQDLIQASLDAVTNANQLLLGLLILAFVGSTLLGVVFSLLALNAKAGRKMGFSVVAGLLITVSFISLFGFLPMMSTAETTAVLNRVIASSPPSYALILLTFPASLVLLYIGQKYVLKRTILSLHTAYRRYRWMRMIFAMVLTWLVLGGLSIILHLSGLKTLNFTFDPQRFFIYAAISAAFIPLQSATEEVFFRGFLNQAIESISRNKWITFVITSLLFMCVHLANPEALAGADAGILPIVMSGYFFFGFAACLMLWIDDGLESAIGVHAANNMFAAILVNYENSVLPTPSAFQIKANPVMDSVLTIIALGLIVILLFVFKSVGQTKLAALAP